VDILPGLPAGVDPGQEELDVLATDGPLGENGKGVGVDLLGGTDGLGLGHLAQNTLPGHDGLPVMPVPLRPEEDRSTF